MQTQSELHMNEVVETPSNLLAQAISIIVHTGLALIAWLALMLVGYALNPVGVPQTLILVLSMFVPFVVGNLVNRFRQDEMATQVWLIGIVWALVLSFWILNMPTGPNECFRCIATEKLSRSFFSFPSPSGLVDNDIPFLGTWPVAALIGYAIGARLALHRRPQSEN
jgi:hypothetical protein